MEFTIIFIYFWEILTDYGSVFLFDQTKVWEIII